MFLQSMRNSGKAKTTINNTFRYVSEFLEIVGANNLDDIKTLKRTDIDYYIGKLYSNGNSDSSRQTKLSYVKTFFNYLEFNGLTTNIIKGFKISVAKRELACPEIVDAKKILSVAINSPEDFAIYYTLFTSGIRVSELINMKVSDIMDSGVMIFGKGKKERFVPLQQKSIDILWRYIEMTRNRICIMDFEKFSQNKFCSMYKSYESYKEEMEDVVRNNYVFVTRSGGKMSETGINRRLKSLAKKAGIDEKIVSPHKIRHVYATNLLEQGVDMDVISEILGHSNVAITHSVYAKTSKRRMKDAVCNVNF